MQLTVHVRDDYIPNCRAAMAHAGVISRDLSVYLSRFITIVDAIVSDLRRLNDHAPGTTGSLFSSDDPHGAREFYTNLAQLMDAGFRVGAEVITLVDKKYPREAKGYLDRLRAAARLLITGETSPYIPLNGNEVAMSEKESNGPSTKVFWRITAGYLVAVLVGAWLLGFFDPEGTPISPNEWGDVLAGVFSPLAFLWLIYASLSQRAELALQRSELAQNNQTQQDQQIAMDKQARALNAQLKRLEAQADATYEPILIVERTRHAAGTLHNVYIMNVGGTALNTSFSDNTSVQFVVDVVENVRGVVKVISHWHSGEKVVLQVDSEHVHDDKLKFTVNLRRLDSRSTTHTYELVENLGRLQLVSREYDELELPG
ncbi:hypothetical protein [Pseudoxanthomonas sp. PXM03]|uniref:hypothetical protein n=1 Tax=Pseudoxanthomonas sp. PXM03 TaxID=2769284 RepID=UPI001CE07939|nr:hypothetical protein [Pseudoxanthomonas sp. PXM03]